MQTNVLTVVYVNEQAGAIVADNSMEKDEHDMVKINTDMSCTWPNITQTKIPPDADSLIKEGHTGGDKSDMLSESRGRRLINFFN